MTKSSFVVSGEDGDFPYVEKTRTRINAMWEEVETKLQNRSSICACALAFRMAKKGVLFSEVKVADRIRLKEILNDPAYIPINRTFRGPPRAPLGPSLVWRGTENL